MSKRASCLCFLHTIQSFIPHLMIFLHFSVYQNVMCRYNVFCVRKYCINQQNLSNQGYKSGYSYDVCIITLKSFQIQYSFSSVFIFLTFSLSCFCLFFIFHLPLLFQPSFHFSVLFRNDENITSNLQFRNRSIISLSQICVQIIR